jgi:hypothetical protein
LRHGYTNLAKSAVQHEWTLTGDGGFSQSPRKMRPHRVSGAAAVNQSSTCSLNAESVIDLDPEIADGAFKFRMSEQKLNRWEVTRLFVYLRRLRPAH